MKAHLGVKRRGIDCCAAHTRLILCCCFGLNTATDHEHVTMVHLIELLREVTSHDA